MFCRVALWTQMVKQRINSEVYVKVLSKPMKNPLGVSPSKGYQGTTGGKEKIIMTTMGIVVDLIWRSWVRFPPKS